MVISTRVKRKTSEKSSMITIQKFISRELFYSFENGVSSMFSPGFAVGPDYYLKSRVSQHRNKRARPKNGISIIIITDGPLILLKP